MLATATVAVAEPAQATTPSAHCPYATLRLVCPAVDNSVGTYGLSQRSGFVLRQLGNDACYLTTMLCRVFVSGHGLAMYPSNEFETLLVFSIIFHRDAGQSW